MGSERPIGDAIREQREAHDLSIRGLAKKAGVQPSLLSRAERNLVESDLETVMRVIEGLGLDPNDSQAQELLDQALNERGLGNFKITARDEP